MKLLRYKGVIVFDDWTQDEHGIWCEICEECAQRFSSVLANELDDSAIGTCSVLGCSNCGTRDGKHHYYADLDRDQTVNIEAAVFYVTSQKTGKVYPILSAPFYNHDLIWLSIRNKLASNVNYTITDERGYSKQYYKWRRAK